MTVSLTHIDAVDDPRVAGYRELRDRDVRALHGDVFVAEGEVVLRVLVEQVRYRVRSVLLSDRRVDAVADVIAKLPSGTEVYVAEHAMLQEIVGFPIHRGVLALGERGAPSRVSDVLASGPRVVVAMAGVVNHDNVGGIFRNAAAFDVGAVVIDEVTCDPLYRKAVRVSVGGTMVVPFARVKDEAAVVDALESAGYTVYALSPRGAISTTDAPPTDRRVALFLGAEGPGLTEATLARCRTLGIPMRAGWDSLNVATSSGIALHWLSSRARAS